MANNHPDRTQKFTIPQGMSKLSIIRDTRIAHACTFEMLLEDHTLGHTVRVQLHKNRSVLFAGYRIPHPLEIPLRLLIKVQTDGTKSPSDVMIEALADLSQTVEKIRQEFNEEIERIGAHQASQQPMQY